MTDGVEDKTTTIIGEHMQPFNLWQGNGKMSAYKRLHNRIRLDVLGWVCRCDSCGGPDVSIGDPDLEHETSTACWDRFSEIGPEPVKAILMGRHLVDAGIKPGPTFKVRLDAAYEQQIEGIDEQQCVEIRRWFRDSVNNQALTMLEQNGFNLGEQ